MRNRVQKLFLRLDQGIKPTNHPVEIFCQSCQLVKAPGNRRRHSRFEVALRDSSSRRLNTVDRGGNMIRKPEAKQGDQKDQGNGKREAVAQQRVFYLAQIGLQVEHQYVGVL